MKKNKIETLRSSFPELIIFFQRKNNQRCFWNDAQKIIFFFGWNSWIIIDHFFFCFLLQTPFSLYLEFDEWSKSCFVLFWFFLFAAAAQYSNQISVMKMMMMKKQIKINRLIVLFAHTFFVDFLESDQNLLLFSGLPFFVVVSVYHFVLASGIIIIMKEFFIDLSQWLKIDKCKYYNFSFGCCCCCFFIAVWKIFSFWKSFFFFWLRLGWMIFFFLKRNAKKLINNQLFFLFGVGSISWNERGLVDWCWCWFGWC